MDKVSDSLPSDSVFDGVPREVYDKCLSLDVIESRRVASPSAAVGRIVAVVAKNEELPLLDEVGAIVLVLQVFAALINQGMSMVVKVLGVGRGVDDMHIAPGFLFIIMRAIQGERHEFIVDVKAAILQLNLVPRQTDDPLDEIYLIAVFVNDLVGEGYPEGSGCP